MVDIKSKRVWTNGAQRIIPLQISQVLPIAAQSHFWVSDIKKLPGFIEQFKTRKPPNVCVTALLTPDDLRRLNSKLIGAKRKELLVLFERGVFQVILEEDLCEDAKMLGC